MTQRILLFLALLIFAGCQPEAVDPALVDLNAIATDQAAAAAAQVTSTRRPLPPTWTPSPEAVFLATSIPPAAELVPTTQNLDTLYYIFNSDAIVKLVDDGSFEELIPIPQVGQSLSGLSLSPDHAWLAYVAPGSGSAREIYVTDREGNNTRQLTNLGFQLIRTLTWQSDSSLLAFVASPTPDLPPEIYTVSLDNAEVRPFTQRGSTQLGDLAWSENGNRLFFSDGAIYALDIVSGVVSIPLTTFTGFGPDFSLAHHPSQPVLYYIKPFRELDSNAPADYIAQINTSSIEEASQEQRSVRNIIPRSLRFSQDGNYLIIADNSAIWVQDQTFNTLVKVYQDSKIPLQPIFSPDAQLVAFVDHDVNNVPQIFRVSRQGGQSLQVTSHQEGTISHLNWARD